MAASNEVLMDRIRNQTDNEVDMVQIIETSDEESSSDESSSDASSSDSDSNSDSCSDTELEPTQPVIEMVTQALPLM